MGPISEDWYGDSGYVMNKSLISTYYRRPLHWRQSSSNQRGNLDTLSTDGTVLRREGGRISCRGKAGVRSS